MSAGEDRKSSHEVVLVRRRAGGHGDGHHGGAWKIAFADFMTALMCFFLVMWLINSTDKKTLTQVATYFNPLRLNDRTASQKGMNDPSPAAAGKKSEEKDKGKEKGKAQAADKAETNKSSDAGGASVANPSPAAASQPGADARTEAAERELLRDPYGVLDRIMSGDATPGTASNPPSEQGTIAKPRDIFDLTQKPTLPNKTSDNEPPPDQSQEVPAAANPNRREPPPEPGAPPTESPPPQPGDTADQPPSAEAHALKTEIEREIRSAFAGLKPGTRPNVEVLDLDTDIMISLTDEFDFGMFAVASARPTPELVLVMEHIGRALARSTAPVAIRGHTDARSYRTADYDNWRLSMARAQTALHMLVRGGLPEHRVKRIEGHADRSLKVADEPLAAQNRRIEILVRKPHP